jgi:hypothetical protein
MELCRERIVAEHDRGVTDLFVHVRAHDKTLWQSGEVTLDADMCIVNTLCDLSQRG